MSASEYKETDHPVPYTFEITANDRRVFYFGVKHSHDANDPEYNTLESAFRRFNPTHVLVEGIINTPKPDSTAWTKVKDMEVTDLIAKAGEAGFVVWLSLRNGLTIESPEPAIPAQVHYLCAAGFAEEDVAAYLYYRQAAEYWRLPNSERGKYEDYMEFYLRLFEHSVSWQPRRWELDALERYGDRLWGNDWKASGFKEQWLDPPDGRSGTGTVLNVIAAALNRFRDKHVVERLRETLSEPNAVFIVYGVIGDN